MLRSLPLPRATIEYPLAGRTQQSVFALTNIKGVNSQT